MPPECRPPGRPARPLRGHEPDRILTRRRRPPAPAPGRGRGAGDGARSAPFRASIRYICVNLPDVLCPPALHRIGDFLKTCISCYHLLMSKVTYQLMTQVHVALFGSSTFYLLLWIFFLLSHPPSIISSVLVSMTSLFMAIWLYWGLYFPPLYLYVTFITFLALFLLLPAPPPPLTT